MSGRGGGAHVPLGHGAAIRLHTDMEALVEHLSSAHERARRPRPLLEAIADRIRRDLRTQFDRGGDPLWPKDLPATVRAKTRRYGPSVTTTTLVASGNLRDSWTVREHPQHIEIISERDGTVEIGSADPKAKYHQQQEGLLGVSLAAQSLVLSGRLTTRLSGALPARRLRVTERAQDDIVRLAAQHLGMGDK